MYRTCKRWAGLLTRETRKAVSNLLAGPCVSHIKMSSDASKRPVSRSRRVNSAKARLTPPGPDKSFSVEEIQRQAKERAKSAKANREKHTSSGKVFPKRAAERTSRERFSSMYSRDFEGTFAPPADLRPTSPTRRNNPHPGKQFMWWRVPTREVGGVPIPEGLELPPEYLAADPNFDAIEELSGNMDRLRMPPPEPSSAEYGAYLHRMRSRQSQRGGYADQYPAGRPQIKPVSSDVLERTVRDKDNLEALDLWLQTASPQEQHTVLKMLRSAEDAQVKDTIHNVMQPGAAKAVQDWMKSADGKEREVAVRLFSSLGSRPGSRRQRTKSEPGFRSRPLSRQPLPPPIPPPQPKADLSVGGEKLHTRRLSAPPGPRPKPWPAGLWHHMPVRDPPPQVYHRGALFGAVRGDASHYTVHPEWPDYYSAGVH